MELASRLRANAPFVSWKWKPGTRLSGASLVAATIFTTHASRNGPKLLGAQLAVSIGKFQHLDKVDFLTINSRTPWEGEAPNAQAEAIRNAGVRLGDYVNVAEQFGMTGRPRMCFSLPSHTWTSLTAHTFQVHPPTVRTISTPKVLMSTPRMTQS